MRDQQTIIDDAQKRFNPNKQSYGYLTRDDAVEFFAGISGTSYEKTLAYNKWIDSVPFLDEQEKKKIKEDIFSFIQPD